MALRTSRPNSLLHDENARAKMVSGKTAHHEHSALQPQQQQGPAERKKLSDITNQVLLQPKQASKRTSEKDNFAIRADAQGAMPMSTVKKMSRPSLKNISNAVPNSSRDSSSKPSLRPKAEGKPHSQMMAPPIQLPSSSKLNLTDEMMKKAGLWAEDGIERVHFTSEDMENLRQRLQDEEVAKRIAMIHSARINIPFPRYPAPCNFGTDFTWEPPGDILDLDVLNDLPNDSDLELEGLSLEDVNIHEELFGCMNNLTVWSPPRLAEGWPRVKDIGSAD